MARILGFRISVRLFTVLHIFMLLSWLMAACGGAGTMAVEPTLPASIDPTATPDSLSTATVEPTATAEPTEAPSATTAPTDTLPAPTVAPSETPTAEATATIAVSTENQVITGVNVIDQNIAVSADRGEVRSADGSYVVYYSNAILDKPEANIQSISIDPVKFQTALDLRMERIMKQKEVPETDRESWRRTGQLNVDIEVKGLGSFGGEIVSGGSITGDISRQSYYMVSKAEFYSVVDQLKAEGTEFITSTRGSNEIRDVAFFDENGSLHIVTYTIGFYDGSSFSNGWPVEALAIISIFDSNYSMLVWGTKGPGGMGDFSAEDVLAVFDCYENTTWCNTDVLPNGVTVTYK